jgi:hypothetical protein
MHLGPRIILLIRFSTGYGKRSIVTPPKNKERRLVVAKPLLPFRVGLNVILVVVKGVTPPFVKNCTPRVGCGNKMASWS